MTRRIGLTGNIGSGKSQAGLLFAQLGACVIEADDIVHRLLSQPCQRIISFVQKHFSRRAIHNDGSINRDVIRPLLLQKPTIRREWETLLRPMIYQKILHPTTPTDTYHLLIIPLLFEQHLQAHVDQTCLITAPENCLVERIRKRNAWPDDQIHRMLRLQMPTSEQSLLADHIICNDGSIEQLNTEVFRLHQYYMKNLPKDDGL